MAIIQQANIPGGAIGTFSSPTQSGSTIVVVVATNGAAGTVTDDQSQSYTQAVTVTNDGTASIFYFVGSVAGVSVVTVSNPSGHGQMYEISADAFNAASSAMGTGVGANAPSVADCDFYVALAISDAAESNFASVSSPWTLNFSSSFFDGFFGAASIDGSAGAQAATFTNSLSGNWAAVSAGFGTPVPPLPVKQSVSLVFQDPAGNPIAGGEVLFRLNTDISLAAGTGPQVSAGIVATATLDNNGACTVLLWANDTAFPTSVYFVEAYTAQGQLAWSGELTVTTP